MFVANSNALPTCHGNATTRILHGAGAVAVVSGDGDEAAGLKRKLFPIKPGQFNFIALATFPMFSIKVLLIR